KKNIIIYAFIIVCSFFSFSKGISAMPIEDECINNKTCLVLCNYENKIGYEHEAVKDLKNITIYYMFDGTFMLRFSPYNSVDKPYKKGPMTLDKLISNKDRNVYWDNKSTADTFICPTNGFVDRDGMGLGEEICFDSDGTTCENKYNNAGTKFGKAGMDFSSQKKDYDFNEQIEIYGKNWVFGDVKEDIKSGKIDLTTFITEKVIKDFKTNFLYGKDTPVFMQNSPAFKALQDNAVENFNNVKKESIKEIEENLANNVITEEEATKQKENFEIEEEVIKSNIDEAIKVINGNNKFNSSNNLSCEAVFGDQDDANYPAYWIQWSLNLMKYIAIVALLVLSTMDFLKAMVNQDKDAIQKAAITTAKRFVFAVLIFFLPIIVEFIMNLFGAYGTCGLG
ncbi:MAG: hypothetical protein RR342_04685, partial [Bacilli bacterium]